MAPAVTSSLCLASHIDDRCTNPTASAKLGWCARKSQTACPWVVTYSWLGTGTPSCFKVATNAMSTMSIRGAGACGSTGLGGAAVGGVSVGSADESWWRTANITTTAATTTATRDSGNTARRPTRRNALLRRRGVVRVLLLPRDQA